MNKLILFAAIATIVASCNRHQSSSHDYDMEIVVLIDKTDHHLVYPDAATLLEFVGVTNTTYNGIRISLMTITDGDYTETVVCELPKANPLTVNKDRRKQKVQQFAEKLTAQLTQLTKRDSIMEAKSKVFRTCAKALNTLSKSPAPNKVCIMYSDLLEHSSISFYDSKTVEILHREPQAIAEALERQYPLHNLKNVNVFLVYKAPHYKENEAYVKRSQVFESIFKKHGAEVTIGPLPTLFIQS